MSSTSCKPGAISSVTQTDGLATEGTGSTVPQAETGASGSTSLTSASITDGEETHTNSVTSPTGSSTSTKATSDSGLGASSDAETGFSSETISSTETSMGPLDTGGGPASSTTGDVTTTGEVSCEALTMIQGDIYLEFAADKKVLEGIECLDGTLVPMGTIGNLSGLENLQIITGNLVFVNEGPLAHANGLSALSMIGGELAVVVDSELEDFSGMENLKFIGGDIRVSSGLKTMNGLQNVKHIGGSIFIGTIMVQKVPSLISTKALSGLDELGGSLQLYGTSVNSLEGFEQLEKIDGDLDLVFNPLLPTCIAKSFAEKTTPKDVQIVGNLADDCGD